MVPMRLLRHILQTAILLAALTISAAAWWQQDNITLGLTGSLASLVLLTALFYWRLRIAAGRLRQIGEMYARINQSILLNQDMGPIFDLVLDHVFRIFKNVRFGSVLVLDKDGVLRFAANRGFSPEYVGKFALRIEESFLYRQTEGRMDRTCLISRRTLKLKVAKLQPETWQYRSVISAPLWCDGKLFGMINLDSARSNLFAPADVRLVEQFRAQIEVSLMARARYETSLQRFNIDALTGLSTRGLFEDLFQLSVERANRYGEAFVLALFDADGLKGINDRLGHLAGDKYLLAMADTLRLAHRKSDILGRYGGDEFIAVYHGSGIDSMRKHLLELLEDCHKHPVELGGGEVPVLFSFGLAHYPEDGRSLTELVAAADGRMYVMKAEHRGRA
jgi:diguanylate cyclase (GGDEF)-like protein